MPNATLHDPVKKIDIGKALIQDGFVLCEKRPGRRFAKIVSSLNFFYLTN
jgi:hypothetical protein